MALSLNTSTTRSASTQKYPRWIPNDIEAVVVMKIFQPFKRIFDMCGRFRLFAYLVSENTPIYVAECPFDRWSYLLILRGVSNDLLHVVYKMAEQFHCPLIPMTPLHVISLTNGQKWVKVQGRKRFSIANCFYDFRSKASTFGYRCER